ncbi:MAG: di-heme oxidoredictase family protein [Planctomycetota bacterium]|jgi:hypothetical protein
MTFRRTSIGRVALATLFVMAAALVSDAGPRDGEEHEAEDPAPAAPLRPRHASERPGGMGDDPVRRPRDLSGRSVKTPRVRAVHASDPAWEGATAYLLRTDPWLGYARGRELFLREFSTADGVYGEAGRLDGRALDDGATKPMSRDHANSCALCHNTPWRDAGAGATIAKNAGRGRNTPHLFGAGLLEMLAEQTRLRLLGLADLDRNGFVDAAEAEGRRAVLTEGAYAIDAGRFDDADGDGRPDLNPVISTWYVDAEGKRIPWARDLDDAGVAGYAFEVQVFGHGQRDPFSHGAVSSTLRAFAASAFDMHSGLTPCDPTLNAEPARDGLAGVSLAGARQFFTGVTRDRGLVHDAHGRSLDDPDRDGVIEEITQGDLDLIEWYQLNHPRPAEKPSPGRAVFDTIGCAACHVPDWTLDPARESADYTERRTGDRRHFDLAVRYEEDELRGRVVPIERGAGFEVRGLYSDLLHHDLGPAFHELQFDGTWIRRFRTSPLWGVGSTAPYGHDGASLDLDGVIRRHGGEAAAVTARYVALEPARRDLLLSFLRGLVLYATDEIPCDVDGDGVIAEDFVVAGVGTGGERCNPEWLFRTPGRVEGWVANVHGERVFSSALTNVREAYGLDLEYLRDRDGDRWPDVLLREGAGAGR